MNRTQAVQVLRSSLNAAQQRLIVRAARQAFPRLADYCLIHVATPRTLRCIAAAHRDPAFASDMRALQCERPIRRDDLASTVAGVVRFARPALRSTIWRDDTVRPRPGTAAGLHRKLAPTSALVVPLVSDGVVLGAVSLCYSQSRRSHAPHHLPLAERLALKIAGVLIAARHAASRLHPAARHARQRRAVRSGLAARN